MTETGAPYKSLLHEMTQSTPTCLWNDSCSLQELTYAAEHGAVGATCNPVIVVEVLKREMPLWRERILQLVAAMPTASEGEIAWRLVEEMSATAAALLRPVFDAQAGRNGRLSVQTDPRYYRDTNAIVQQAVRFAGLAPNIIVKIPVTTAGVAAIEEATYRGLSINATVCFSLPQCVAVAEAVERGLQRREAEGLDIRSIGSVCTIMVGRLDDWLKVVAEKRDISVDPGVLEWAGVAVFKKTYQLFQAARLSTPPALSGLPQPHALERVHRRRRRDLATTQVAAPVQRQRRRRRAANRRTGGSGDPVGAAPVRGLPAGIQRGRSVPGGVRPFPADPAHAASVHRRLP